MTHSLRMCSLKPQLVSSHPVGKFPPSWLHPFPTNSGVGFNDTVFIRRRSRSRRGSNSSSHAEGKTKRPRPYTKSALSVVLFPASLVLRPRPKNGLLLCAVGAYAVPYVFLHTYTRAREERVLRKVCWRRFFGGSVFADLVAHFHKSRRRRRVLEVGGKGF